MLFLKNVYDNISNQANSYGATLVAVSKTKSADAIMEAYNQGVRDFGENYVQELLEKEAVLPKDIRWHFIGHLQSNKVKYLAPFVHLIHAVDSEKLLTAIHKQGEKMNRVIPCLLQVHIAAEETKFGFSDAELQALLDKMKAAGTGGLYPFAMVKGVMGMASFTEDNALIEKEFAHLRHIYDQIRLQSIAGTDFCHLSMGMSADYGIALKAGSNMLRIGSMLFGSRIKP